MERPRLTWQAAFSDVEGMLVDLSVRTTAAIATLAERTVPQFQRLCAPAFDAQGSHDRLTCVADAVDAAATAVKGLGLTEVRRVEQLLFSCVAAHTQRHCHVPPICRGRAVGAPPTR